jgi:hypothetical protein
VTMPACCTAIEPKVRMVTEDPTKASLIGRLEVLYGVGWGAVCSGAGDSDERLQDAVAAVACKQLGFDGGTLILYFNTTVPPGPVPELRRAAIAALSRTMLGPAPASVVRFQLVANFTGTEKALEKCKGYAIKPVPYTYVQNTHPAASILNACGSDVLLSCMKKTPAPP